MSSVTVRELRNQGGEVLGRVLDGETLVVTRDGLEVAELRPLRRRSLSTAELISRRRFLPPVDVEALRRSIDEVLDPAI